MHAVGQDILGDTLAPAHQVDARMHLPLVARLGREQPVERDDAVDLGRRHVETFGDVVDRGWADPTDAVVDGVQRRQQQVAAGSQ